MHLISTLILVVLWWEDGKNLFKEKPVRWKKRLLTLAKCCWLDKQIATRWFGWEMDLGDAGAKPGINAYHFHVPPDYNIVNLTDYWPPARSQAVKGRERAIRRVLKHRFMP